MTTKTAPEPLPNIKNSYIIEYFVEFRFSLTMTVNTLAQFFCH